MKSKPITLQQLSRHLTPDQIDKQITRMKTPISKPRRNLAKKQPEAWTIPSSWIASDKPTEEAKAAALARKREARARFANFPKPPRPYYGGPPTNPDEAERRREEKARYEEFFGV
jgi:hypothetical protein